MQGRFHYYEGYSLNQITYPIRIMRNLGIDTLLVSNACGALNPMYGKGDLMLMRDHINYLFDTPLKKTRTLAKNKRIYDESLIELAESIALENKIKVRQGVYCALRGPALETRAEYRMVRKMGADVVGMSTIPEALLSGANSMRVLGFSIVTDIGFPDTLKPAVLSEILETAAQAEPELTLLMKKIIERL
jgi:purine-nucleoside phosphorylase